MKAHKYFKKRKIKRMIMAAYFGNKMISGKSRKKKEAAGAL